MSNFDARPDTDQQWEDLIGQLRHQPLAQPRPFFYSRVQTRLTSHSHQAGLPNWIRRPAYALLLGALVLVLGGDGPALASGGAPVTASAPAPR
ncbi:hypothetical protein GCM10028822_28000 [Hymenobacter terrigena]